MPDGPTLAKLLRQIATAIDGLDAQQIEDLIYNLKSMPREARPKPIASRKARFGKIDTIAMQSILDQLRQLASRQQGIDLLDSKNLVRNELAQIAKLSSVHISKEDSVSQIREKIVETTIGARLGSAAIRGGAAEPDPKKAPH